MRILSVIWIAAVLAVAPGRSSADGLDNLRNTFINCVETDFWDQIGAAAPKLPNTRVTVERAFADCQTEEMAYLSSLASALAGFGNRNAPIDAAAAVGRIKLGLKGRLVF